MENFFIITVSFKMDERIYVNYNVTYMNDPRKVFVNVRLCLKNVIRKILHIERVTIFALEH